MCPQIALCDRCIVALTAFEQSFSRMSFPMSAQINRLNTEVRFVPPVLPLPAAV